MTAWRQRTTAVALCVLLLAATALAATEEKKKFNVKWVDAGKTAMEKAVDVTQKLKDHVAATGKSVNEILKDNGVDLAAGFSALTSKLTWKDTRDTATKFKEAAEKLQKSLEETIYPKVKNMGEQMIYKPKKGKSEREKHPAAWNGSRPHLPTRLCFRSTGPIHPSSNSPPPPPSALTRRRP